MSSWVRVILSVIVGLIVWTIVATLGNLAIRAAIPGYHEQELATSFSLGAQIARLALGLVSTAVAAWSTVGLARGSGAAAIVLGLALLAMFVPIHISIWSKFPIWYHLFFLASLPAVAALVGQRVATPAPPAP